MFHFSSCSCLCPVHWGRVLSREWRCSRSSTDRWCSKYIWVIHTFIAHKGATYITADVWRCIKIHVGWNKQGFSTLASDWLAAVLPTNQKQGLKILVKLPLKFLSNPSPWILKDDSVYLTKLKRQLINFQSKWLCQYSGSCFIKFLKSFHQILQKCIFP